MEDVYLHQLVHDDRIPIEINLKDDSVILGRIFRALAPFKQVSRHHARLNKINGSWFIEDLKSINGVYVNHIKIHEKEHLKLGDTIGLGIDDPSLGFVCALSARKRMVIKKEPVEVIELLSDEDQEEVELTAQNHEIPSCSNQIDVSYTIPSNELLQQILQLCKNSTVDTNLEVPTQESVLPSVPQNNKLMDEIQPKSPIPELTKPTNVLPCSSNFSCTLMYDSCYVKLQRCDSPSFVLPPDVLKVFRSDEDNETFLKDQQPENYSDSDSDVEEEFSKLMEVKKFLDYCNSYPHSEEVLIDLCEDSDSTQTATDSESLDHGDEFRENWDREVDMESTQNVKPNHSPTANNLINSTECSETAETFLQPPVPNDGNVLNSSNYETVDDGKKFFKVNTSSSSELTLSQRPKQTNSTTKNGSELHQYSKGFESDSSRSSFEVISIPSKHKIEAKSKLPSKKTKFKRRCEEKSIDRDLLDGTQSHRKTAKSKTTPANYSFLDTWKDFKIPKKTNSDGPKAPERVFPSVLSAVEVPNDKHYPSVESGGKFKKSVPVIARRPGKRPSRFEMLSREPRLPPRRRPKKPKATTTPPAVPAPSATIPNLVNVRNVSMKSLSEMIEKNMQKMKVPQHINQSRPREKEQNSRFNLEPPGRPMVARDPRTVIPPKPAHVRAPSYPQRPITEVPNSSAIKDPRSNADTRQQLLNLILQYPPEALEHLFRLARHFLRR